MTQPNLKKKKETKMPKRSVSCGMCGHVKFVNYNDPLWHLSADTCPQCLKIKADFPALFQWVTGVFEKNRLTDYQVEDIVDRKLNYRDNGGYY
jgi:hypothetical protein